MRHLSFGFIAIVVTTLSTAPIAQSGELGQLPTLCEPNDTWRPALVNDEARSSIMAKTANHYESLSRASVADEPKNDDPKKKEDQPKKDDPKKDGTAPKCHDVEVNCREECVPGCDPPDEKGTLRNCSSCHHKERKCDLETVCDGA